MLLLPKLVHDQMVAHCLAGLPDEACGLLGGTPRPARRSPATRPATWRPRPSSTPSTPRSTCGPTATPRPRATRSSGSSTPTPTPRPIRPRPMWPRHPIRPGTTCWCRCGTSCRWSGATGSSTGWSPRSRSGCSPGRIPTELVNIRRVVATPNPRRPSARPSQPADRPAVPRRRCQGCVRRRIHRRRGAGGPGRAVPRSLGPGHRRRRDAAQVRQRLPERRRRPLPLRPGHPGHRRRRDLHPPRRRRRSR